MVTCSYCDKELDREVFCNTKERVAFHRSGKVAAKVIAKVAIKEPETKHLKGYIKEDDDKQCPGKYHGKPCPFTVKYKVHCDMHKENIHGDWV